MQRGAQMRLLRDNIVIYDGAIASLQRFKDSVKEVASGYECGITFEKFQDIKEGDISKPTSWSRSKFDAILPCRQTRPLCPPSWGPIFRWGGALCAVKRFRLSETLAQGEFTSPEHFKEAGLQSAPALIGNGGIIEAYLMEQIEV